MGAIKHYPNLKEKKIILYVPTFRNGKSAHIYDLINSVNDEKYNLIIRLHPLDKAVLDSKYTVSSKYQTFDLLKCRLCYNRLFSTINRNKYIR